MKMVTQSNVSSNSIIHPEHYVNAGIKLEPIVICRLFPFCFGNAIKYILRAGLKCNAQDDYDKAAVYLRWSKEDAKAIAKICRKNYNLIKAFDHVGLNFLLEHCQNRKSMESALEYLAASYESE